MAFKSLIKHLIYLDRYSSMSKKTIDRGVFQERLVLGMFSLLTPLVLLMAWQLAVSFKSIDTLFLPSLTDICSEFVNIAKNGYGGRSLIDHLAASLSRIGIAFIVGSILGIALGLLMGYYKYVNAAFSLITEILRPLPPLAFIPLFILWFGIGEVSKVMIILYSGLLIVMLNTISGVRACPEQKILAGYSLGASDRAIFLNIILPSALPQIMTGVRIALSVDFGILVASELLGGDNGLGFIIQDAGTFFNTKALFVGIFLIGFLGVIFDRLLGMISTKLVHWEGK
ncbi:MAG: putative aliphatic sulfonates transport permease protein SsuC [Chroococcidiopsis cubana SAG 39.79]|uniref:Taurine ABC transporter permease n=2 Tax=Chroococcidiopsis TaxID=54298 RepID=A0AB37UEM5_9CYAN|nr:putative aliphatic sulfonates transport permease protein SsuC [Chroococcidiopsis cubana SAG 39.79]RUT07979.1 taurine ABC transporter permease [Chroococcidiopsis cubana SAG 39.79]